MKMALRRDYKETVMARIKRDRKFARALYAEALGALLEGETAEGLSMLRDLVHAEITFKELARQTGRQAGVIANHPARIILLPHSLDAFRIKKQRTLESGLFFLFLT